ncbi:hypothetical protein VOLCADRAFT_121023 [Volvox carteri f. nagariensis]|uniref:Chalcone isomerase domain-containing protein n=1 Tax=Volvox carteri f. nagariensis TaxID=3068 RepID=D8TZK4_VOLCA|nr:uncharacterized protein VOLCADRAFT_121023 [Volvox carteri f. nagariensis]EFJ47029.1 hypothetical protein VOLCADRAFT_121023 [Volvox carteri f. nagariensis]|eukprot:XP_002951924.1 hypothetical protein VOLCADRAFT_121023 [Volvox carteri f. nagariensis]
MLEPGEVLDIGDESSSNSCTGRLHSSYKEAQVHDQQEHSLQHLLAVGSRQWGSGGWWDGRGLLRVKIYDFAVYADPLKAAHALRNSTAIASPEKGYLKSRTLSCDSGGGSRAAASYNSPTELLVSPASRVDMSLTIRACRNLPLQMLSEEFERILQRRHEKAGGRADDPALRELLSYFSKEKLPEHVLVTSSSVSSSPSGGVGDAVRKGSSITFSRSSSGALVTEAGGRVLGRVESPALAEALFDLYLGDQPVSKRAKAAAGAALLDMAAAATDGGSGGAVPTRYRYRPQPGEKLVCGPGAASGATSPSWGGLIDVKACILEVP